MVPAVSALRVAMAAALFVVAPEAHVSAPVAAQESLPACDPATAPSACRLAPWPDEAQVDAPSAFGPIAGLAWVEDAAGDAPPAGLDILAVGVGQVDVADPKVIRDAEWLLKAGKAKRAVRPGENVLVRIVLDRAPGEAADPASGHAGVHVATDIDRSRSNNAPAGVVRGEQPFAGSEDVYSVTYASTTGQTRLLDSDLSRAWYKDDDPFAAAWASPTVLDMLLRPEAVGDGLRVITYTSAEDGGYDSVSLGWGPIPVDGMVGFRPDCLEASIATEPFVVRRLVENGQVLRNVEAPSSWRGGAAFAVDGDVRDALASLIAAADDDEDGTIGLASTVMIFEDGTVMEQRPEVQLALAGADSQVAGAQVAGAQLALELGLTRRGYEVLREVKLEPTGIAVADAWLARAADALTQAMPPFRSGKRAGLLIGEGIGACASALIQAPVSEPDEAAADSNGSPETDA